MKINYLKRYIISSYVLVWLLIIFVAGSASLIFHAPPVIMWIIRNIIAWFPTYLLLIGWRYYRPDEKRIPFVKRCFSGEVNFFLLLSSFALTFGISIYFLIVYIWTNWRRIGMAWFLIYSVLLHFGFNIIYVFLDANIGFFVILTILYLLITPLAVLICNRIVRTF